MHPLLPLFSLFFIAFVLFFHHQTQQIEKQAQVNQIAINLLEQNAQLTHERIRIYKQFTLNFDLLDVLQDRLEEKFVKFSQLLAEMPEMIPYLNALNQSLQKQNLALDHIKSSLAVFNNSYRSLPAIIANCHQKAPIYHHELDKLSTQLAIQTDIQQIYQQFQKSPIAQHCPTLLKHLEILYDSASIFKNAERELAQLNLPKKIQATYNTYNEQLLKLYRNTKQITYLLFTLGFTLFFIIWQMFIRLKQVNEQLSHSMSALEKSKRLYQALSETNQAIAKITQPQTLFQNITDNLHKYVKISSCWIGEIDAHKALHPIALSGTGQEAILQAKVHLTGDYASSHILADKVYQEDHRSLVQDYVNEKKDSPYYKSIRRWGVRSIAIYPIHLDGKIYAMLFLYSTELNFFDSETDHLIQELVEDIELALHKIQLEQKQEAFQRELQIAAIAFETQEAIIITDDRQRVMRINQAAENLYGYSQSELIGKTPRMLLAKQNKSVQRFHQAMLQVRQSGVWEDEIWSRHKDRHTIPVKVTLSAVFNKERQITHYIAHIVDRSTVLEAQNQIQHLKLYDPLTHLPNRSHLKNMLTKLKQGTLFGALFLINLSGFKRFNEALGSDAGDEILKKMAQRLVTVEKNCTAPISLVSRISADEFILFNAFHTEQERKENIFKLLERIENQFKRPFVIGKEQLMLNYNMGITLLSPGASENAADWLRQVDIALNQAKANSKESVIFYENSMQDEVLKRHKTQQQLIEALEKEEFVMYYQPQIDLSTGRVIGAESLIRWQKPTGELIPPFKFIPILETSDLMIEVGKWIIRHVIQTMAEARTRLNDDLLVAINLSAVQFNDEHLCEFISQTLQEYHYPAELVELEVTESVLMDNLFSVQKTLKALQNQGCKIAIDDFGTGYSSFNYLKQFSANKLKIDKTFIDHIEQPKDAALVRAMAEMAHALGSLAIAEGAETEAQIEHLKLLGCDEVQGYYYSRPLPFDEFVKYVKQHNHPN